jgi:hypothetical protein
VSGQSSDEVILLLDADLGSSAHEAAALLEPLRQGAADMSIGILPTPTKKGGFGLVKGLARNAIRTQGGGFEAQAPLSGQRALTWACLEAARPIAQGYGVEVALTIKALQKGFRVIELPVALKHRATGRDLKGFAHRGHQYRDIKKTLRHL